VIDPALSARVDGLRLHLNENTGGCSPAVLAALHGLRRADVGCYPDVAAITATVERWFGVAPGWVQITNGLDEGLQMAAMWGAWHGDDAGGGRRPVEFVIVEPAFEVYEFCATAVGARAVHVLPEPDFRFPLDQILGALTPATRVVYVTDPNNPTGIGIPADAVERIASAAPQAIVVVDEAYADFSGRTLIGPLLERQRNVVIGRTFAKAHGLAALRAGALVAHPATLDRLRPTQLPFSVNIAAVTALEAALADHAYLEWYVAEAAASRERIYDFCRRRGLTFWPSEANFVLMRVGPDARAITAALRERRILVRDKSSSPGCDGCIRVTAGLVEHTATALSALEDILASRTR
jgi:histidinol-phosphate aminotransferase